MNMRQVLACCLLVAITMAKMTSGAPLRDHFLQESQACGDQLANIMRLVCSGKGYNIAFRPEHHRARRGIVEECCYRSCTLEVLEQYCQGEVTEHPDPPNNGIRKCSDEKTDLHTTEKIENKVEEPTSQNIISQELNNQKETKYTIPKTLSESEENFRLLNFLDSSEHLSKKKKLTQNDTTEEDFINSKLPLLRHHKHHQRQLRGRKSSVKTKRDKSTNLKSFQIGTVKPYFVARPVASPSL